MKILAATMLLLAVAAPVGAQERNINLFDTNSNDAGYMRFNPRSGQFTIYDKNSNTTGYGKLSPRWETPRTSREPTGGMVDLYNKNSGREGYGTIQPRFGGGRSGQ